MKNKLVLDLKGKNAVSLVLVICSIILLLFCPIRYLRIYIQNGVNSSLYRSMFTAFFGNKTIVRGEFTYFVDVNKTSLFFAFLMQVVALWFTRVKKLFPVGVVLIVLSWVWMYFDNNIVINYVCEAYKKYASVAVANISLLVLIIVAFELATLFFNGLVYLKTEDE